MRDGNFLSLLNIPACIGINVSPTTLAHCSDRFASCSNYTFLLPEQLDVAEQAELALSIDVIFHLVEEDVFVRHIDQLFDHSTRFVLIYTSNFESAWPARHVRHRRFSTKVAALLPEWHLLAHVPNRFPYNASRPDDTSFSDFFLYGRTTERCVIRLPTA
jgi:hypothetical protein